MPPSFQRFIAVDWSGAMGRFQKGIQVAICERGTDAPRLQPPPEGTKWSRQQVCDLILRQRNTPTLIGIDFAFAYAFADHGAYFPGFGASPADVWGLWALIEDLALDAPHLYGGEVFRDEASPVRHHYWSGGKRPKGFEERRRVTEWASASEKALPHPVFKTFSAANVGTGSLAGMRMLHRLQERVAIWPFDAPADVTVVEIFPKSFVRKSGVKAERIFTDPDRIDATLAHYASAPYTGPAITSEDQVDALLSAAALRHLSQEPAVWAAPDREPAAMREGWIFGVT